jgi:cephalosporin-C deacetylase-like acetyl esterase
MSRKDIEFKNGLGITLRGWLYTPTPTTFSKLPCLVMCHGFTAVKEMVLDKYAEAFIAKLQLAILVFDNRGFGASDAGGHVLHIAAIDKRVKAVIAQVSSYSILQSSEYRFTEVIL